MSARRAPIGRLVDLAVAIPTCTMVAATRAVPLAARVGTLGAARLVGRVSEAVHDMRHGDDPEAALDHVAEPVTASIVHVEPVVETVAVDDLPIAGYDDLAARQVVDRLGDLDPAERSLIELYERAHRNRSTVIGKISMLTE